MHGQKWNVEEIEKFQWEQARRTSAGDLEKPERLQAERLYAVRSSKAGRLKRIKPGFFNPPGDRLICVPGFHWLKGLVIRHQGPPTLYQHQLI